MNTKHDIITILLCIAMFTGYVILLPFAIIRNAIKKPAIKLNIADVYEWVKK